MGFEILKACLIPLFQERNQYWPKGEETNSPKTELWQVVASGFIDYESAVAELEQFRQFNAEKGFTYRLVETYPEPVSFSQDKSVEAKP